MSLKSELNQIIKDRNGEIFTLDELKAYCEKAKYKLSNAERRLRPSDSPDVESIYNEKKTAIIGYKIKQQSGDIALIINKATREFPSLLISSDCCPSYRIFKVHARDCETQKVQTLL